MDLHSESSSSFADSGVPDFLPVDRPRTGRAARVLEETYRAVFVDRGQEVFDLGRGKQCLRLPAAPFPEVRRLGREVPEGR